MNYMLSPCVGSGTEADPFRPAGAGGSWAALDLRTEPTSPQGWFLVEADRPWPEGIDLGDDPDRGLPAQVRADIRRELGVTVPTVRALAARTGGPRGRLGALSWGS